MNESGWIDEAEFQRRALLAFPELFDALTLHTGLLHLQVGAIESLANQAIADGELGRLQRCYDFFMELAALRWELHPEVLNAIHVSFLEGLHFEHRVNGQRAKDLLPPVLRLMREEVLARDRASGTEARPVGKRTRAREKDGRGVARTRKPRG